MHKRYLPLYLCLILLLCKRKEVSVYNLIPGKILAFSTPQKFMRASSNFFCYHGNRDCIFYFSDKTVTEIEIFTKAGCLLRIVPLNKLLEKESRINDIIYDTIAKAFIVLADHTNNIYKLDDNGQILGVINISRNDNHVNHIDIYSSICADFTLSDTSWLFQYSETCDTCDDDLPTSIEKYKAQEYFIKVSNPFTSKQKISLHLKGFYNRFLKEGEFNGELSFYTINDKNVLLASQYSDTLYVINKESLEIERTVPIQSAYAKIGVVPPMVKTMDLNQPDVDRGDRGRLFYAVYDPYRKLYYVYVQHGKNRKDEKFGKKSSSSVVILDDQFRFINEQLIFFQNTPMVMQEGIYVATTDTTYPQKQNLLQFYEVSKNN